MSKAKKVRINVITRDGEKPVYAIARVGLHPNVDRVFVLHRAIECFEQAGDALVIDPDCTKGWAITDVKTGLLITSLCKNQKTAIDAGRERIKNFIDENRLTALENLFEKGKTVNNKKTVDACKNLKHYKLKNVKHYKLKNADGNGSADNTGGNGGEKKILAIAPDAYIDGKGLPVEIISREPREKIYQWKDRRGDKNSKTINKQVRVKVLEHKAFSGKSDNYYTPHVKIKHTKNSLTGMTFYIDRKYIDYFPIRKTKAIA